MVYVLNKFGNPLMPCSPAKAKKLLKGGKAKVVRTIPFTIQLLHGSSGYKQDVTLGIDTGYENVGASALTAVKELFASTIKLRTDIQSKLESKRMYRRTRRGRLRYRKPRFLNRKKAYADAPSIRHKVNSHLRVIQFVQKILPISKIVVEAAAFDAHAIKNPQIEGVGYQLGEQYGYQNVKEYVKARDRHRCHFNTTKCSPKLQVHHIQERSNGGSNAPTNLITLCEKCHTNLHKGKLELPKTLKHKRLRAATFMNTTICRLKELLPDITYTYGYITKQRRYELGIEKSHLNDAFVIAGGTNQNRTKEHSAFYRRRNNRSLGKQRKGFAPSSRKQRYPMQPHDIVEFGGKKYVVNGTHCKGSRVIIKMEGKKKSVSVKKVNHILKQRSLIFA